MFLPSAAFLYDVAGFSLEWLRDLAVEQRADGLRAELSRPIRSCRGRTDRRLLHDCLQGSAGWGDAIVMVPWEMYRVYGDDGVLAELWPAMVRWVDYAAHAARSNRSARARAAARPDPAPHEAYLWDGGFHWGEWFEPGGERRGQPTRVTWRPRSCTTPRRCVARIGRLLGHDDDAERFEDLAAQRRWMRGEPNTSTTTDR